MKLLSFSQMINLFRLLLNEVSVFRFLEMIPDFQSQGGFKYTS